MTQDQQPPPLGSEPRAGRDIHSSPEGQLERLLPVPAHGVDHLTKPPSGLLPTWFGEKKQPIRAARWRARSDS